MPMSPNQMNPAYMLDPSLYGDQQAIDQQRQLAQLLMTQGFTPDSGVTAGGISGRRSPFEAAGRLAQLLSGQSIQGQANVASQALMQRLQSSLQGLFAQQQEQAPAGPSNSQLALALGGGPTNSNARAMDTLPPQQPQVQNRPSMLPRIPGDNNGMLSSIAIGDPSKYAEMIATANAPTDATKQALQGGFDPQYANKMAFLKATTDPKILAMRQAGLSLDQIYKAQYGEAAKAAEIDRRGGNQFANHFTGESGMVPKLADNANPTGAPGPTGAIPGVIQIPGTPDVLTGNSAATGAGTAQTDMVSFELPDGTKQNMTRAQAVAYSQGAQTPGYDFSGWKGDPVQLRQKLMQAGDFGALGALDGKQGKMPGFGSGQGTAAGAEAKTTATKSAEDAVSDYNETHKFATGSAPRNIQLLQSIQQLAGRTLVGPGSDKVQFVNGVLNSLGITPGADQAQNYQIMSKNLGMLVGSQRMAASGGGSDALQTLLTASNPNNKEMNAPALREASEELIAYNRMMMAKDRAMPSPTGISTQEFQKAQTNMAPLMDPRLWQLEHAASDKERARILGLMPPDESAKILGRDGKAAKARALGLLE